MVEKLQHEHFVGRKGGVHGSVWILARRTGSVVLVGVLVVLGVGTWRAYEKRKESAQMRAVAETEYNDLIEREYRLKNDIETLSTNRGKEAVLREKYGLAKEGEHMVMIVDRASVPQPATTSRWRVWMNNVLR